MAPRLLASIAETRRYLAELRLSHVIGLVPTMGALHAGHGALIERARCETDAIVVSIFANPIQFNQREDYENYPADLDGDLAFCAALGVDLVFAPSAREMYPSPQAAFVDVPGLAEHLCGPFRPGHFRGVATVVAKLFHIVAPDKAYFGEKDAQQLAIIQRMVADLDMPIEIVPVATAREPDGLALSSRNRRLSPAERRIAPEIFAALEAARGLIEAGCTDVPCARRAALDRLEREPLLRVEYLEVVDPATMAPVAAVTGPVRIAAAVWLGNTRLIDNVRAVPR